MFFTDDIMLIGDIQLGLNDELNMWREIIEFKRLKLSRFKIEYVECKFNDRADELDVEVRIGM